MKRRIFSIFVFFLLVVIAAFEIAQIINQPSDTIPGWHTTIISPIYYFKYLALLILLLIFGIRAFKSNNK